MLAGGGSDSEIALARLTQAEGFFRKGEVLVKMGDFRGAAELLQTATELWTDESIYHGTLGWALLRKTPSEPEAARVALERALELDSQSAQSHFWMSHVQRKLGNVKAADMALSNARSLDPQIGF
jgi:tetratricopeptide (TPR) repeat protein